METRARPGARLVPTPPTPAPAPGMELEVPPSTGRMRAMAEGESGGSGGGKGDKWLFPKERGSLLTTRQRVRNPPWCPAGGSHQGWDDGSELTLSCIKVCTPQKPPLAPHRIGTAAQTQPGCQFRRRMLLDLAVAGTSRCPGGWHSVMATEECCFGDADVEHAPFSTGPSIMGPLSPPSLCGGAVGGSS